MTPEEVEKHIGDLEVAVDRLRSLYEQYFMGFEKLEPLVPRKDVDRRIHALRKEQVRNTAQRFRFQMLLQRYNTYQTHWQRILREIENGTYKRHVARAVRRFALEQARPVVAPQPGAPVTDPEIRRALAELEHDFAPPSKAHRPHPPPRPPAQAAPVSTPGIIPPPPRPAAKQPAPPPAASPAGAAVRKAPPALPRRDAAKPVIPPAPQPALAAKPAATMAPKAPAAAPPSPPSPSAPAKQPPRPAPRLAPPPVPPQPPQPPKAAAPQVPRPTPSASPRPAGQPPPLPPAAKK